MKENSLSRSLGLIDLHFHGAFGIDLMAASPGQMDLLSEKLWEEGIAGFCATTLSVPLPELLKSVERLGKWIRSGSALGAQPLGIHLEGPYISPNACGAHPPEAIRALNFKELDLLWSKSQHTLKILTVAPEILTPIQLKKLTTWARARQIVLSAGHSRATQAQAKIAFDQGFSSVTHAWNALAFHQRSPGVLGAALGRKGVSVELIIDGVHVSQPVIRWTLAMHKACCFVSDCVPAAATRPGTWHSFGHLKVRFKEGACRLKGGDQLAGGGKLLTSAYTEWLEREAAETQGSLQSLLKNSLKSLTAHPLRALGLTSKAIGNRQISWRISESGKVLWSHFRG